MDSENANIVDADSADAVAEDGATSRRGMLRLAGAAAAGAAVAAVGGSVSPANADFGSTMVLGNAGSAGTAPGGTAHQSDYQTRYDWNPTAGGIGFFFQAGSTYTNGVSNYDCALAGWTTDELAPNGVYGYSDVEGGVGVVGVASTGGIGVRAEGGRANMYLSPWSAAVLDRTDTHGMGELIADVDGKLWYCTAGGTPGTWVELTAPGSRYFPITPGRLYDSRGTAPTGVLASAASRNIALRNRHDINTYASNYTDYVPAGATALTVNLTVRATVGAGFLAVNPLGDFTVHAATANWSASGQTINSGVNISLGGDRQVTVIAGGQVGASAHFIIDVTGYYI